MSRPKFEVAHVIKRFAKPFVQKYKPNAYHLRVLNAISICRTSQMGGHTLACDRCGQISISYNSCRNRHCPKCQLFKQVLWADDLMQASLPVKHYHIVFTLPHELNDVCLLNSGNYYNMLFASAWDTLRTFGYSGFGTETGAICVLHTWGQSLGLHPHLHCIVPAAGLTLAGNWKYIGKGGKYLYPVNLLSVNFRGHFMKSLKAWLIKQGLLGQCQKLVDMAWNRAWVVFCEPSLAKPEHVVKYLGNYTHRVAISNSRIINISGSEVTFMHKDYADAARQKPVVLDGVEFLRRFCMHVLPKRFVKIRRYGVYSSTYKAIVQKQKPKQGIETKVKESLRERLLRLTGFDMFLCPVCKLGKMQRIEEVPRARSPTGLYALLSYC